MFIIHREFMCLQTGRRWARFEVAWTNGSSKEPGDRGICLRFLQLLRSRYTGKCRLLRPASYPQQTFCETGSHFRRTILQNSSARHVKNRRRPSRKQVETRNQFSDQTGQEGPMPA